MPATAADPIEGDMNRAGARRTAASAGGRLLSD
jgi:hypothetical protein